MLGALGLCGQVLLHKHSAHGGEAELAQRPWHFRAIADPSSAAVLSQPAWEHCAQIGQWPDKKEWINCSC